MGKENIKIRKKWPTNNDFDPNTKVHKTEKSYQRHNEKKAIEDALQEAEEENTDLNFDF